jgi:hypothetical protein
MNKTIGQMIEGEKFKVKTLTRREGHRNGDALVPSGKFNIYEKGKTRWAAYMIIGGKRVNKSTRHDGRTRFEMV